MIKPNTFTNINNNSSYTERNYIFHYITFGSPSIRCKRVKIDFITRPPPNVSSSPGRGTKKKNESNCIAVNWFIDFWKPYCTHTRRVIPRESSTISAQTNHHYGHSFRLLHNVRCLHSIGFSVRKSLVTVLHDSSVSRNYHSEIAAHINIVD